MTGPVRPERGALLELDALLAKLEELAAEGDRAHYDTDERYRCVDCLHRFELRSVCPNCGEHSTIVRMSNTALYICGHCQASMLAPI